VQAAMWPAHDAPVSVQRWARDSWRITFGECGTCTQTVVMSDRQLDQLLTLGARAREEEVGNDVDECGRG